jgi:cytochrome c oxidase cbb3-type subunit 3
MRIDAQGFTMIKTKIFLFVSLLTLTPVLLFAQDSDMMPITAGVQNKAYTYPPDVVERGHARFVQNCAFCHGRNATGGEGPNLTHSSVVANDVDGVQIGQVVRNGRGRMPQFKFTDVEVLELAAFIHTQATKLESDESQRRQIGLSDLMTGDAKAGEAFFNGNAKCAGCHSPKDFAGLRNKYEPVQLERVMLYPDHASVKVVVTTFTGGTVAGTLVFEDEFSLSVVDESGWQRSWSKSQIKFQISDPAEAHRKLLPLYTIANVHDLFAYLETL